MRISVDIVVEVDEKRRAPWFRCEVVEVSRRDARLG